MAVLTGTSSGIGAAIAYHSWRRIGLVSNAASIGSLRSLEETEPQSLMNVFAVNVVAPIFLMAFCVQTVPVSAALRIVNIELGRASRRRQGECRDSQLLAGRGRHPDAGDRAFRRSSLEPAVRGFS